MNANTIGYYLMPNPTDTAAAAPYLPKLVPNGVANLNDVAAKVAESLAVSEERAKLLIRENFTESLKMALDGYTVDMGALRMKARIPGSMPCEDTPFDPETNACVIELYADTELADAFDALKPVKLTAAQLANAIKVSNVMDVGTERFGEICGTEPFMILGNGVTLDAAGESAKLVSRKTGETLATAEVESVSKGQRATCTFAAVPGGVPKGAYWLVVTTFGLIGETTPRVFRKPVTLVEPIPTPPPGPEITKVTSGSGDEADVIYKAEAVVVHGERFAATQDDTVTITKGDTDTWEWTGSQLTIVDPDGKLSLSYMSCKHNGETGSFFVGDDPCELVVSFKGSTRTVQYAGARA